MQQHLSFGYDDSMKRYLKSTGRSEIAELSKLMYKHHLTGDKEVYDNDPNKYFDQINRN